MTNPLPPEEKNNRSFWDSTIGTITKITALITALTGLFLAVKPYLSSSPLTQTTSSSGPKPDSTSIPPPSPHQITPEDIATFVKAGESGDIGILKEKIDLGIDADATVKGDPTTALVNAVMKNKPDAVRFLLEHKASNNVKINGNSYPIIEAAFYGYTQIVTLLVNSKADLNVRKQDGSGITALMFACFNGHKDVVQQLIDAGADVDIKAVNNATALDFANGSVQPLKVQIVGILNGVGAHSGH